jgi:hypothetical protein
MIISKGKGSDAFAIFGPVVKLALTGGLLRYFENYRSVCGVWCSRAGIGPLRFLSMSVNFDAVGTQDDVIELVHQLALLPFPRMKIVMKYDYFR